MYNKAESAPSCNRNLILENKLSNRHVCSLSFSQLHGNFSTITDYSVPRTCNHGMQMEFLTKFPVHFGYAGSRWKLPLTKGSVCLFSSVLGWSKGIPSTLWCLFFPVFPQAPNSHSTKLKARHRLYSLKAQKRQTTLMERKQSSQANRCSKKMTTTMKSNRQFCMWACKEGRQELT